MTSNNFKNFMQFDSLALLMMGGILFMGLNIAAFSYRYLKGDLHYRRYFGYLASLLITLLFMVCSDHFLLFGASWLASNLLLCLLIIHKASWKAARSSGILALKNFLMGACFIYTALILLYWETGHLTISGVSASSISFPVMALSLFFLTLGAMTQSAIWPFHRWLISSVNSPTPVSALMHAGLVNGGGLLLLRFHPLFLKEPFAMQLIFIVGIITCLLGTMWKLILHDIKRCLAASTVGQMGFMFAQFGMGLFPAAVAHILLHGLYKSFLFLNSGNAAHEKRMDLRQAASLPQFFTALFCGLSGAILFALTMSQPIFPNNAHIIPQGIAWIAGAQLAIGILSSRMTVKKLCAAFAASSFLGGYYGICLLSVEGLLGPGLPSSPQPLNFFYLLGFVLLAGAWAATHFMKATGYSPVGSKTMDAAYVAALNGAQPCPETITALRKQYRY